MAAHSVTEAIAAYHTILDRDSTLAAESAEHLAVQQPRRSLTFGPNPLCGVLRPQFLSPATYARIQEVCGLLATAMFRLAELMPTHPDLLEPLHLTAEELDLVTVDPGFRQVSPTSRLDSFMAGDTLTFVEYNAETPAAVAYEDVLSELFLDLPVARAFAREYVMQPLPARRHLLATVLDAYRQWGGSGPPCIAIVDWEGLPTASEFELFSHYFSEAGCDAIITQPEALEYDGRRLSAAGRPIDIVYRRVLTSELLGKPEAARALVRAYTDHAVCVINSFRSKLLHKKMSFALLSDDRYVTYFTDAERAAIAAHIPWTREVRDGKSTHQGRSVDLLEFALLNRDRLVLKPNDEYGGKGVMIGWEMTDSEWDIALRDALNSPHVMQERAPVERVSFPMWYDNTLHWQDLTPDLDPFLFNAQVHGALTRLSSQSLLNVTAGTGSVAPTFLVERR